MGQIVASHPFRQEHAFAAIVAIAAALTAPAATLPRAAALQPALAAAAPAAALAALALHAAMPAAAAAGGCALLLILLSLSPLLLLPILLHVLLRRQLCLLLPLPLLGVLLPGVVLIKDVQRPGAANVPQPQLPVAPACVVQEGAGAGQVSLGRKQQHTQHKGEKVEQEPHHFPERGELGIPENASRLPHL